MYTTTFASSHVGPQKLSPPLKSQGRKCYFWAGVSTGTTALTASGTGTVTEVHFRELSPGAVKWLDDRPEHTRVLGL